MAPEAPVHFLNVSYFFRLLYDLFTGGRSYSSASAWAEFVAFISNLWLLFTILAFLLTFAAIAVLVHSSARLYATRRQDSARYATIGAHAAEEKRDHSRWAHVVTLIESPNQNDWRQAIIEADIMLDDLLTQLGYVGATTGEKLKAVNPEHFKTINDAWEAHKIRNEIAHQGSSFQLTDHLAYRTIKKYENVMVEHGEI